MRLHLPDEAATIALARRLAARARLGDAILLAGPLGAGKTTFARAFIRAAAGDNALEIPSPTFTLVQEYETPIGPIAHYDLWRLTTHHALAELGWDDLELKITLVEWPDRLGKFTPPHALHAVLSLTPAGREINFSGEDRWFHDS